MQQLAAPRVVPHHVGHPVRAIVSDAHVGICLRMRAPFHDNSEVVRVVRDGFALFIDAKPAAGHEVPSDVLVDGDKAQAFFRGGFTCDQLVVRRVQFVIRRVQ